MSLIAQEQGQTSAEYLGVIITVSLLAAVLVSPRIGPRIAGGLDSAICSALRSNCEERALVERLANGSLEEFEDYKHSIEHDGRLDYSDDDCSAPVVGSTGISFDFTRACERHDFGYRNYKRLGLFDEEKRSVDRQFLQDMLDHCAARSVFQRGRCRRWAYVFFAGVAAFGGHCDPPGPVGRIPGPCAPEYG